MPGIESDPSMLKFKWNCTKVTDTEMEIKISYEYEDEVSAHENRDKLKI